MKIVLDDNHYLHEAETTTYRPERVMSGTAGFIAKAGEALVDLNKEFEGYQQAHEVYKFFEVGVYGIVLEMGGEPMGIISMVDDTPQYTAFTAERKPS